ncbi:type IV pilin protein [Vibrio fluminensis]|uniref:type IV pilin protein n=1 Tax=Vibrio fluminensis TaxID=2783614 RepID=UPI0018870AAB|nr:prepilin-type N-terminal cleavage/methylation domain-containing protein [Vibrio fluminensis]
MKNKGFTLIELIVVIVILAILSAVAIPKFIGHKTDARIAALEGTKAALSASFELFAARVELPSTQFVPCRYHQEMRCMLINDIQIRVTNEDDHPFFTITDEAIISQLKQLVDLDVYKLNDEFIAEHSLNLIGDYEGGFHVFSEIDANDRDIEEFGCRIHYIPSNKSESGRSEFVTDYSEC